MIQIPSTIESISTRKDRTLKVVVGTQELDSETASELMRHNQLYGYFMFAENKIKPEEVPVEDAPEFEDEKSPSQRLYNCLYVYWKQQTDLGKELRTFNQFRIEQMEKFIQAVKNKLD